MRLRKPVFVSLIWLLPALLILAESLVFLPRALRNNSFVPYFIVFWGTRALLAPVIIFYTLRTWVEYNRAVKLVIVHLLGFLLFSVLFWGITYLLLHDMLLRNGLFGFENTDTQLSVFSLIADNSLSTNIIVYVSTVAFCYIWEFFRRNMEDRKKAADLEKSLLVSRLELLKGQLNTHFLFNTLHTISSLVVRNKNEEANLILVKLSELLRFALKENNKQLIPLKKEIEILQLYLDIQQTRFRDRLNVNIEYGPELNDVLMPALLLQPLVENAIKYAIEPFTQNGKIDIDISKKNGSVSVDIRDNGPTRFDTINFASGIGLQNTRERLQQLFGDKQSFAIAPNLQTGTHVSFSIPLQFSNNGSTEDSYS